MLIAAAAALAAAAPAAPDERAALVVVETYLRRHNAHDVDGAAALFADDAVFRLSAGRPAVAGRAAIRELLRFDAVAGSNLDPRGASPSRDGDAVVIGYAGVVERSRMFRALGLDPVTTLPQPRTFVVRSGRIVEVNQPAIKPACLRAAGDGLRAFVAWLGRRGDPRGAVLAPGGAPRLAVETLPAWIAGVEAWRRTGGWAPVPADAAACARVDF